MNREKYQHNKGGKMKYSIVVIGLIFGVAFSSAFGQTEKVRSYVKMVAEGKIAEAKWGYKQIAKDYPNDPGVIFLGAVLDENAANAVKVYKKIVTDFPKSEWADDAYWRLIQYNVVMNELAKAKAELEGFKLRYPSSVFLEPSADLVRVASVAAGEKPALVLKKDSAAARNVPDLKLNPVKANAADDETGSQWGWQIGVFNTSKAANTEMNNYKKRRMAVKVVTRKIDGEERYSVVIGSYKTKKEAEAAKTNVSEECKCSPVLISY